MGLPPVHTRATTDRSLERTHLFENNYHTHHQKLQFLILSLLPSGEFTGHRPCQLSGLEDE